MAAGACRGGVELECVSKMPEVHFRRLAVPCPNPQDCDIGSRRVAPTDKPDGFIALTAFLRCFPLIYLQ